jgi:hypothetical protein
MQGPVFNPQYPLQNKQTNKDRKREKEKKQKQYTKKTPNTLVGFK